MNQRQTDIVNVLREDERVSVKDLALRHSVAEMTIRRDLDYLEREGLVTRTHGGAATAGRLRFLQSAFPHYHPSPEKTAIGKAAAALVGPGEIIMVDAGTTTLEVVRHLPKDPTITIATVSLCVAQELYGSPLNVLLLGGFLHREFPGVYGPMTETNLRELRANTLFMGCDGADSQDGFYMADMHISRVEQAMIKVADRVVVVTESTKFGRRAFTRYAEPHDIHTLITDDRISKQDKNNLEDRGVRVIIAGEE